MELALVSVIIPSYNRLCYIKLAIESVLHQSYGKIELIVVDDGSTDDSISYLRSLSDDSLITFIAHPDGANLGQSASINAGIRQASGGFVVILDSDDCLESNSISRHVNYLNEHAEVGMVYGNGAAVDGEGKSLHFNTLPVNHKEYSDPNRLLLNCYIALPGASMVRSEVYAKVGFFEESFRAGQDHDMALRIFEDFEVSYIPETAFYYRKHSEAISSKGLERRWRTGFEILDRARERYPYSQLVVKKRAAVLNFRLGHVLLNKGRFVQAIPYLFKSAILDPIRSAKVILGIEKFR